MSKGISRAITKASQHTLDELAPSKIGELNLLFLLIPVLRWAPGDQSLLPLFLK
jgi:hypothetical protein